MTRAKLREIYDAAAADLAAEPTLFCQKSGRCCRFTAAGHQLFLTRLEFDEMVRHGAPTDERTRAGSPTDVCPWLVDGLCDNREGRALACRTYFCSDEQKAAEITEIHHQAIRDLHDETGVAYEYRSLGLFLEGQRGAR